MQLGRVVWNDYEEHNELGLVCRTSCRMENGRRRDFYVQGVEPTAYVLEDEELPDRDYIVDVESGYESLFDDELKKVTTKVPKNVNDRNEEDVLVNHVSKTFEADLPFYRKTSIKDGLSGYVRVPEGCEEENGVEVIHLDDIETDPEFDEVIEPRVMIADIEVRVSDEESFEVTREGGTQPINVICSYDSYDGDYTIFFYDKYDSLEEAGKIREHLEDHWGDESYAEDEIVLKKAETEEDMLEEFINHINDRDFDLTSGWNWINFDYEYIINRCKSLDDIDLRRSSPFGSAGWHFNDQMKIAGRGAFDMMRAFCDKMSRTNWRSKALDYVANEVLDGVGKLEDVNINESWKNDAEKLLAYNVIDVQLCVALDKANDIHNFYYELADTVSIPIYDTYYEKRIVDGYAMARRGEDEILPSAEEEEVPNAGGYVDDPIDGMKENVGVSDLKSLYPSAMLTWNLSTETVAETPEDFDNYVKVPKVPEPKDVEGGIKEENIDWDWLYASMDEQGLLARIMDELFEKRNYEKAQMAKYDEGTPEYDMWDRKQWVTKAGIMNSIYGNASSKYWRLSNEHMGSAITSCARYTLWKGMKTVEDSEYRALYGDTDSIFIQLSDTSVENQVDELKDISERMDEDASDIATDIGLDGKHPFLKDSNLHGDDYTCMKWEAEKLYQRLLQLGQKKRYCGNISWKEGTFYEEPKISISGFEFRRSDSPPITAELQEEVIEMILTDSDFEEVADYICSIIDQIDESSDDVKRFALPGSINKALHEYPNRETPRACMYSNNNLGYDFGEGDDPFVYYVDETPSGLPETDVVAFEWNEEIPEGFELDKEAIIERAVEKPIQPIINEIGWTFDEVRTGQVTQTMDLNGSSSNPFQ